MLHCFDPVSVPSQRHSSRMIYNLAQEMCCQTLHFSQEVNVSSVVASSITPPTKLILSFPLSTIRLLPGRPRPRVPVLDAFFEGRFPLSRRGTVELSGICCPSLRYYRELIERKCTYEKYIHSVLKEPWFFWD